MNAQEMLEQLEALGQRMSIKIRYEKCRSRGGVCRVKGESLIIVRKNLTVHEKVDLLSRALCKFPLEDFYVTPEVRQFLEKTAVSLGGSEADGSLVAEDLEDGFTDSV